jgi:hypothetical protein
MALVKAYSLECDICSERSPVHVTVVAGEYAPATAAVRTRSAAAGDGWTRQRISDTGLKVDLCPRCRAG